MIRFIGWHKGRRDRFAITMHLFVAEASREIVWTRVNQTLAPQSMVRKTGIC
jgi:hypothetical protein